MNAALSLSGNDIIHQTPTRKSFALAEILSLSTGLRLKGVQVHALVGFLTGRLASPANTATQGADARDCLMEQLPFLKDVDVSLVHNAFRAGAADIDGRMEIWLDTQVRLYGPAHYVMPRARWQRRAASHKL